MNTEELIKYIDSYFNGHLSPGEEILLFSSLSNNQEARQYFKEQHVLKAAFRMADEPFPSDLDGRIMKSAMKKANYGLVARFAQPTAIAASALSLVFLVMVFILFGRMETYRFQMNNAMIEIKNQKQTIELLMNGLPTVQVTSNSPKGFVITNN